MKRLFFYIGMVLTAVTISSCDEETLNLGNTLTSESDKLDVLSASYTVQTKTVLSDDIVSRNNECYFGRIKDPETGAYVTSEFMTQLNLLETFNLPAESTIQSRYDDMAGADSCSIDLYMLDLTSSADTLAAMKMRMVEMDVPAEESKTYYTSFDPAAEGMLREDGLVANKMFTYSDLLVSDSLRSLSTYYNSIKLQLNKEYTDKSGNTYNNYGTYLMQQYYRHPEYFKNAYTFIHHVCPGFFFQITDGLGFHAKISEIGFHFYFKYSESDSVYNASITLAGTDEVLRTTKITNETDRLQQLVDDPTCTYIKSPVGLFTEVTLPIDEITVNHENDSIIGASIYFQRINNAQQEITNLSTPTVLLMLPKDSLSSFFSTSRLPDNKTSYLCSYSATSSGTIANTELSSRNRYLYQNISDLIAFMAENKRKGQLTNPSWTAEHPNWNKVLLVPVKLSSTTTTSLYGSSSASLTGIEHNSSLTSTKLIGGDTPVKLDIIYAKFKE